MNSLKKFFQTNFNSSDSSNIILNLELVEILFLVFILYIISFYYKYFTRVNPLNGPIPLPLIGNLHLIGIEVSKAIKKLTKQYGPVFEIYLFTSRCIIVTEPKDIEKIYSSSSNNKFFYRPELGSVHDFKLDDGVIFNNNYQAWKYNRKLIAQALLSPRLLKQSITVCQQQFDRSMKYWQINHGTEKKFVVNMAKWAKAYTTDSSFRLSTGITAYSTASLNNICFNDVKNEDKYMMEISQEFTGLSEKFFDSIMKGSVIPSFIRYFPILRNLHKKWLRNISRIKEILHEIIKERRKEIEKEPLDKELSSDLLTSLLIMNTERDKKNTFGESSSMNDQQIIPNLLESTLVGIDTSGNLISIALNLILTHKEVKEKMLEEINRVFVDDLKRQMSYEDYEKMEYSQAVVKEVLRYHTLIPVALRETNEENAEICGYNWPTGTIVMINSQMLHKHSGFWEDADKFKPERFLKDNANKIGRFTYVPFGDGVRICPGRLIAKISIGSLLINLLRNYDVEYYKKGNQFKSFESFMNIVTDFEVTLKPKN